MFAAYFGATRRLLEANVALDRQKVELQSRDAEINKLKTELGKLTIKDPGKVHILALPSNEDWHWRWRVYLPPGKTWAITKAIGENSPREGFDLSKVSGIMVIPTYSRDEFTAEAWLQRDLNGTLRLNLLFADRRFAWDVSEEDAQQLFPEGRSSTHALRMSEADIHDPAGPIELLRLHKRVANVGHVRRSINSEGAEFGVLLFFEELEAEMDRVNGDNRQTATQSLP